MTLNKLSQTGMILQHLMGRGSITQVEAQAIYKCRSLTRRIADLREEGYDIKSETRNDPTGQRYVRYWMRNKQKNTKRANDYVKSKTNKLTGRLT